MLEITRSVSIKIDEAGLKQLIIDKVAAHDPNIVISAISFVARRNPPTIEAMIEAHMEPIDASAQAPAKVAEVADNGTDNGWDEEVELPVEEEAPATEQQKDPASAFLETEDTDPFQEETAAPETATKKGGKGKPKAAPEVAENAFADEEEEEEEDPFL